MSKVKIKRTGPALTCSQSKTRRFAFTLEDDVQLLKSCLQNNPFQLGKENWKAVLDDLKSTNQRPGQSIRGIRDRVQLLITKYQSEQLTCRTGTEEAKSERTELLDEVIRLVAEANSTITEVTGAADTDPEFEVADLISDLTCEPLKALSEQKKAFAKEKKTADAERSKLLDEKPPSPKTSRAQRNRLSAEEELIKSKIQEDLKLENRKLDFEEKKLAETSLIEMERLALELKREERLAEESKRRDELAASQLKMQSDMFQLMQLMLKNNN